jgi:hypothetical protein
VTFESFGSNSFVCSGRDGVISARYQGQLVARLIARPFAFWRRIKMSKSRAESAKFGTITETQTRAVVVKLAAPERAKRKKLLLEGFKYLDFA